MVKATTKFLVTINAPNSSLIDVNKILLTDMNLQFNGRLPAVTLPTIKDLKSLGDYDSQFESKTYGFPKGKHTVEPRDVGFPIQVNQGPATGIDYPTGTTGPTGTVDTGNPANAKGFIVLVEAPSTTTLGGQFQIKIHVRNDGTASAKFKARVEISSLGIVNDPTAGVVLRPGEVGVIRKTMIMPANAEPNKLYPATIQLLKVINPVDEATVQEDEEVSTIPGPNVTIPPTPTPTPCKVIGGLEYCKSNTYAEGCIIEDGIVYCPTVPQPTNCIVRNGKQYCKATTWIQGCIIENNIVYCPTEAECIEVSGKTYCLSNTWVQGCIVQNNKIYCPTEAECITVSGQTYCLSNTWQTGCIVQNNKIYCPSPPTDCITVHGKQYCRSSSWHHDCIFEHGKIYCPVTTPTPPPTGNASISAPSSIHDGESFSVRGSNFQAGETVNVVLNLTWRSSRSHYNGKTYTNSTSERAGSYNGSFSARLRTEEVPSGVTATATITATGSTSGRVATTTISIL